jgi:hypothetical protein|tara:strand:- start:34 stop:174 length:141 start_codon:yes stop_codon:yes gene_type:complete
VLLRYSGSLVVAVEVYTVRILVAKVEVQVDLTLEREMVLKGRPPAP